MPKITGFCACIYVLGCRLSVVRLCGSDFGITPVDDITIGITCAAFCFHIAHISFRQYLVLVLFVGYCFGEIMCIWDSYVYQKGVLCFLIHKSYVRPIKRYCFVRKYAAILIQLIIIINTDHMKFAASFIFFGSIICRCIQYMVVYFVCFYLIL